MVREMLTASRSPPPLPTRKKALPAEARQSGCTHTHMTRLFDEYGASTCSVCRRHSSFGWLYRCTQDTGGFLPESDFSDEASLTTKELNSSYAKPVDESQDTPEQIEQVILPKNKAQQSIKIDDTRPTTASSTSAESTTFSELPESTTFSTSTSLDEELRAAYDWATLQKVWQPENARQEDEEAQILEPHTEPLTELVSSCSFRICATCRPTYRERAFQSLDRILNNPVWPPQWELDNRPVSDARVVANIGLAQPKRLYAHDGDVEIDSSNKVNSNYPGSQDVTYLEGDQNVETSNNRHSRSGFRETVRNALKRAHNEQPTRLNQEDSDKSASDSMTDSVTPFRRSMIFLRRKSRPTLSHNGSRTHVVGNDSLQDSLNLMLAANTPLPPSGPNTPIYPPAEAKRSTSRHRSTRDFDEGDIIAHE